MQIRVEEDRKVQENSGRITAIERKVASGSISGIASSEQRVPNVVSSQSY